MTVISVLVELDLDGVWTDITTDVLQADGIRVQRGRPDEAATADPATCTLTLKNRDGRYSSRNPLGPYFGLIGRNTPIRVTVEGSVRFVGEVSAWPQSWGKAANGNDARVMVTASGVLRRLGQGTPPLRSVFYRALTSLDSTVAYWPCEDSEGATEFASALPEAPPMYPRGTVEAAVFEEFKASEPLPRASAVRWIGNVLPYTTTGQTQLTFLMAVPVAGSSTTETVCRIRGTGTAPRWDVDLTPAGSLVLRAYDQDDGLLFSSGVTFGVNGKLERVSIELTTSGSNINWRLAALVVGESVSTFDSGTLNSRTFGRAMTIGMNVAGAALQDTALGHIAVQTAITSLDTLANQLAAYEGEHAADRVERLCGEADVPVTIVGDPDFSARLGPQLPLTFLDLLREAEAADMGILYEPRASLGLAYRTRTSIYAQDPSLTLDYSAGQVFSIEPTDDDDAIRNDITVSRVGGSSARAQLETGPLSVLPPPDGVGRYDDEVTVSLRRDEDLAYQAAWRLHMGTVDEARYPILGVNLANSEFVADPGLAADAEALDVGGRIVVENLPSWLPPGDVEQVVQGFTETIGQFDWSIDMNCTPGSPWNVAVWDADEGPGEARYSSDGTELSVAVPIWGTALVLDGVSPGRASTPDAAHLDIVGDIDLRVHIAMDDWTPASTTIVSKWDSTTNQRSYRIGLNADGTPFFSWSSTGANTLMANCTSNLASLPGGSALWLRAVLDVDNGAGGRTTTFYISTDGSTWTVFGTPVTTAGTTSIFAGTAPLEVSGVNGGTTLRIAGKVAEVQVRNSVGSMVANPVFAAQPAGTTSFADSNGNTWTINTPAVIEDVPLTTFPSAITVVTATGPSWSAADAPYDILIGGECMTLYTVSGTGSGQVLGVIRGVDGIITDHPIGSPVTLCKPALFAL